MYRFLIKINFEHLNGFYGMVFLIIMYVIMYKSILFRYDGTVDRNKKATATFN